MQILFTRSTSILSRIIRKLTDEPVSHCAIEFEGVVIHCNLLGLHVESAGSFLGHSQVVFAVTVPYESQKLMNIFQKYEHRPYDFGGLLYLGLQSIFGGLLPRKNLWQTTGMFLCTEWVTEVLDGAENHTITPYQLYKRLAAVSHNNTLMN